MPAEHAAHNDGHAVFLRQRNGRGVHDLEVAAQRLIVGELIEAYRVAVFHGVLVVHAVHLGGLDDGVALEFRAAQGRRRVGGEIGIARARRADDDAALFHVANGATMNVGFAKLADVDGRKHARGAVHFFEGVLHRHRVHDGGQHADVVGVGAIHALGRGGQSPEDVAAADDKRELHAQLGDVGDLLADAVYGVGIYAAAFFTGQSFAAQLEQHAPVFEFAHRHPLVESGCRESSALGRP